MSEKVSVPRPVAISNKSINCAVTKIGVGKFDGCDKFPFPNSLDNEVTSLHPCGPSPPPERKEQHALLCAGGGASGTAQLTKCRRCERRSRGGINNSGVCF